jgi:hypothetical protein
MLWDGSHGRADYRASLPPFTARRIRFMAESLFERGWATRESPLGNAGTSICISAGAGAIGPDAPFESAADGADDGSAARPGRMGAGPVAIARGSRAAAKPDEAGAVGVITAGRSDDGFVRTALGAVGGASSGSAGRSATAAAGVEELSTWEPCTGE